MFWFCHKPKALVNFRLSSPERAYRNQANRKAKPSVNEVNRKPKASVSEANTSTQNQNERCESSNLTLRFQYLLQSLDIISTINTSVIRWAHSFWNNSGFLPFFCCFDKQFRKFLSKQQDIDRYYVCEFLILRQPPKSYIVQPQPFPPKAICCYHHNKDI